MNQDVSIIIFNSAFLNFTHGLMFKCRSVQVSKWSIVGNGMSQIVLRA